MANNKLAIIGGSGLYDVEEFKNRDLIKLDTPWGKPSDDILKTTYNGKEIYFLPRHGNGHFISPSQINFRANIDALKQLEVTDIVSVSAVGSLKEDLPPGKFVLVDQFIDRTFARNKTFFDDEIVAHVSMAHPTSNGLMNACEEAIKKEKIGYQRGGTYIVMEGPQFSTLAESNLYRSWNADVVGMTNMPEAKLAREAEIRYASVSMVTDFDCWHPDHENVDVQQVIKVLLSNAKKAKSMIKNIIDNFEKYIDSNDPTNNCLDVAIITSSEKRTLKTINKLKTVAGRVLIK
jgi:5'-methylthioadenosine phosphorylase